MLTLNVGLQYKIMMSKHIQIQLCNLKCPIQDNDVKTCPNLVIQVEVNTSQGTLRLRNLKYMLLNLKYMLLKEPLHSFELTHTSQALRINICNDKLVEDESLVPCMLNMQCNSRV